MPFALPNNAEQVKKSHGNRLAGHTMVANLVNPLTPRRTQVSPFTEIPILFWEGIIKKMPILGYVPKNDEKKNLVHKGLIRI